MGSFEWMELQTLTSDINASRSRLTAARANKDNRLVRVLEAEITEAEARRDRLLASITTNLAASGEAAQNPPPPEATDAAAAMSAGEEPTAAETAGESAAAEPAEEPAAEQAADEPVQPPAEEVREAPVAAAQRDSVEGDKVVWDQLTPADIQRALSAIGDRRTEMLARHAEELKSLEVEQAELEGLEKAIDAFVRRMSKPDAAAAEATASAA